MRTIKGPKVPSERWKPVMNSCLLKNYKMKVVRVGRFNKDKLKPFDFTTDFKNNLEFLKAYFKY
jgi:hypothetical protein